MALFRKCAYLLLFLMAYFSTARASNRYRYDYTYNKDAGGWFKLHRAPATFIDAFFRCKLEGALLASPLNEKIHKAMVEAQTAAKLDCAILTGIHATISKGDFTSVEGVPLAKIPLTWAPHEPDNFEDKEDCIIMLLNGTVADVNCNDTFPYMCFKKKTANPMITACGTLDAGYSLEQRTGSCYKFHASGQTWRRAQMTCLAEGGHLAIINSLTEAQVLKELFSKYPTSSILNTQFKDSVSLGFLDWDQQGSWYTVNGQSLEEAGFAGWLSNRPSSLKEGRHCGSLYRPGQLDDVWCDNVPFAFICEKKPDSLVSQDDDS